MERLLNKGCHVVTDNWYTSLRLANYSRELSTTITGVVRAGRGPPREMSQLPLERQQCIFVRKENALVLRWQDEDVTVLNTKCKADMVENVREYFEKI